MELILLVISWTFVGVLVFVSIVTCLSLIGVVKFQNPKQQNRLFQVLIVQVVAICISFFNNKIFLWEDDLGAAQPKIVEWPAPRELTSSVLVESAPYIVTSAPEQPPIEASLESPAETPSAGQEQGLISQNRTTDQDVPVSTFQDINLGDRIYLTAKDATKSFTTKLYDSRPARPFGTLGAEIGQITSHQVLKVLSKYTTPIRQYKWLYVELEIDGIAATGWFSWGNVKTDTFVLVD